MKQSLHIKPLLRSVGLLTLILHMAGCAFLEHRYGESCNTRAYIANDVTTYIHTRFDRNSPVRVAIIPFTTPANLAAFSNDQPGLGNLLAWRLHAELLRQQSFPITEVLNRQDWPGKKEEFFTGNFGALEYSRVAGYDLALVGYVEPSKTIDSITVHTKLIEVESGVTLWYGRSTTCTRRQDMRSVADWFSTDTYQPAELFSGEIIERTARCIAIEMMKESS